MTIISPEKDKVSQLVDLARGHSEFDHERFDPTLVTRLGALEEPEETSPIFLKKTGVFLTSVGHKTVALFSMNGPARTRENSEDIIHHGVDRGLLQRRLTEIEAQDAVSRGIRPELAWVFEMVVPQLDQPDTVNPTGVVGETFDSRAY